MALSFRICLGFLTAALSFATAYGNDTPKAVVDNANDWIPDLTTKKSNLRATNALVEEHRLVAEDSQQKLVQIDLLSQGEKVDIMETLLDSMIKLEAAIDDLDFSGSGFEGINSVTETGRNQTNEAIKVVNDAIAFIQSLANVSSHREDDSGLDLEENSSQVHLKTNYKEPEWKKHKNGNEKSKAGDHKEQRRRAKNKFDNFNHHDESFHRRASSHHARKLNQFHEAIYNGDVHGAFSAFNFGQQTGDTEHSRRRLKAKNAGRLSKNEQCKLLSECALHMSMYDMFVYYYSDDIDPANGEVDDNLLKFDEQDLRAKRSEIRHLASLVRDKGPNDKNCDNLLKSFHRTIEHGDIPEWEGASINQVCLAEGSTVFVQFQHIANALADQRFDDTGYNQISEQEFVKDTKEITKLVSNHIAVEPFQCAEELFYKGDRKDEKEEFPFGGCEGKDSNKCSIYNYKFPVGFDVATKGSEPKRYETVKSITKCDRGYQIKTREQCIEAGQAVGGKLENGRLKEGNWGHVPCGCYLYPKHDNAIHWVPRTTKCRNEDWRFLSVCEERRNRDDYELVQFKSQCDAGYEVYNMNECYEASQALGGWLANKWDFYKGNWDDRPCGCFLNTDYKMHYNYRTKNCGNYKRRYMNVCKRKKDRKYVSLRRRTKCDKGFEIKTKDECIRAAKSLGGNLRNGKLLQGNWGHTPCGCFLHHWDGHAHWDTGRTCRNDDKWKYDVVCKPNPIGEKYKTVQTTKKCDPGEQITTIEDCAEAGQALGGFLDRYQVTVGDWSHTPCGCFLDRKGEIHFDKGKTGCANRKWDFRNVCHQAPLEREQPGRDEHGKLLSNDNSGFKTISYDEVHRTADSCMDSKLVNIHKDCLGEANGKVVAKYFECRVEKRKKAIEECDRFGPIQTGLELVFGTQTSPGFICGIKDAVVNDGVPMPGTCCLDAPYELDDGAWGQPYQCGTKCKNPGPFLAGINKEACDAQGGTWCPSKSNCGALKTCISRLMDEAQAEKRLAFVKYLQEAPPIEDKEDRHQCGRTRGYFGFDENFINDLQICEDIEQLKFANDFDFLNEFFKQGSDVATGGDGDAPDLNLIPPDRSDSEDPAVQGHDAWKGTIFALKVVKGALEFTVEQLNGIECPCDTLCISENICKSVKLSVKSIFTIILMIAIQIFDVAENLFEVLSDEVGTVRAQENTEVIYENMQLMADYMVEMRTEIRDRDERRLQESSEPVDTTLLNNTIALAIEAAASFEVKMKPLQGSKNAQTFVALATLNGVRVETAFTFSRLNDDQEEVAVEFNQTKIASGKCIISFGQDVDASTILFMEASPVNGTQVTSDLLSLA